MSKDKATEYKHEICYWPGHLASSKYGCEYDFVQTYPERTVYIAVFARRPQCLPCNVCILGNIPVYILDVSLLQNYERKVTVDNWSREVVLFVRGRWARKRAYGFYR